MSLWRRRLRSAGDGSFEVRLPRDERALLGRLPAELDELLGRLAEASSPVPEALRRLFPVAYPTDPVAEENFAQIARGEVLRAHREALGVLAETASATRLTSEQLAGWLAALNELRLVLGTALGVSEESVPPAPADPSFGQWALYGYLSLLVEDVVAALSGQLPPPVPGADEAVPEDSWGEPPGGLRWDGTPVPKGP